MTNEIQTQLECLYLNSQLLNIDVHSTGYNSAGI